MADLSYTPGTVSSGTAAGGDLANTYPNPAIAAGAVNNAKVSASAAIALSKLADPGANKLVGDTNGGTTTGAVNVGTGLSLSAGTLTATGGGVSFPLTSASDQGFQPDSVANNTINLQNPASAVNGINIAGAATTLGPTLSAVGSDTVIPLNISTKGSADLNVTAAHSVFSADVVTNNGRLTSPSNLTLRPDGQSNAALTVVNTSAPVNGLEIDASNANQPVSAYCIGSDTNIGLVVSSKGNKPLTLQSPSGTIVITGSAAQTQANFAAGANPARTLNTNIVNGPNRRMVFVSIDLNSTVTAKAFAGYITTVGGSALTQADVVGQPAGAAFAVTPRYSYSFAVDPGATYQITSDVGAGGTATLSSVLEVDL